MVFFSRPTPVISTSATSPAFIQTGGSRLAPTPPGVPVRITVTATQDYRREDPAFSRITVSKLSSVGSYDVTPVVIGVDVRDDDTPGVLLIQPRYL